MATLLVALLIGGYMSAALLATAVGSASGHWRGLWLAGFAVATGLVLDVVVTFQFQQLARSGEPVVSDILRDGFALVGSVPGTTVGTA